MSPLQSFEGAVIARTRLQTLRTRLRILRSPLDAHFVHSGSQEAFGCSFCTFLGPAGQMALRRPLDTHFVHAGSQEAVQNCSEWPRIAQDGPE